MLDKKMNHRMKFYEDVLAKNPTPKYRVIAKVEEHKFLPITTFTNLVYFEDKKRPLGFTTVMYKRVTPVHALGQCASESIGDMEGMIFNFKPNGDIKDDEVNRFGSCGVGTALFEKILEDSKLFNVKWLGTSSSRKDYVRFIKNRGFVKSDKHKDFFYLRL